MYEYLFLSQHLPKIKCILCTTVWCVCTCRGGYLLPAELITVNWNVCNRLQLLQFFDLKIRKYDVEDINGSIESDLQVNIVCVGFNTCICYS